MSDICVFTTLILIALFYKLYYDMARFFFFLVFLLTIALVSFGQISQKLFFALPDTLRPTDRNCVLMSEYGKVFRSYYSIDDPQLRSELEVLAVFISPRYIILKNPEEKMSFLNDLSWFWFQRNRLDSTDKYSRLAILEASKNSSIQRWKLAYAYKIQGYVQLDRDGFSEAYEYFLLSKSIFEKYSDSEQIGDCNSGILMIFRKLKLFDRVIYGADSNILYVESTGSSASKRHLGAYLRLVKARAYIDKYREFPDLAALADSAYCILNKIACVLDLDQKRWRIEAYTELSRLSFFRSSYLESVAYSDSALTLEGDDILENTDRDVRIVYKGLSCIKLGLIGEGFKLIKSVDRTRDAEYNDLLLTSFVEHESENRNFLEALEYHKEYLAYVQRSSLLKHLGRVFELEKRNEILEKDLFIVKLKDNQKRLFRVLLCASLILILLGFYVFFRYKIAESKTRILLDQVEELTEIYKVKLENVESVVRKKIARDLHDDFSSTIAATVHFLTSSPLRLTNHEEYQKLHSVGEMLRDSYQRARALSHKIYHDESEQKFWDGLIDYWSISFSGSNIRHFVEIDTDGLVLPIDTKIAILMCMKEATVNIVKHSQSKVVNISARLKSGNLVITLMDDGKGFKTSRDVGLGLESMANRIREVKGTFYFDNVASGGGKLVFCLPVVDSKFYRQSRSE